MPSKGYLAAKRAGDVLAASVGLVVAGPVLAGAAVAVRRSMGRPTLFRQQRAGQHGRPFDILKLRTMRELLPGEELYASDDARLTALGRRMRAWSVDELPQLVNVLRGPTRLMSTRRSSVGGSRRGRASPAGHR
jgi:lipopolysaccharide/colanic/teichoic acid biosynthesis glycosyltransferase